MVEPFTHMPNLPIKPRRPWLAFLLSLLVTGLGQVYNGQWRRGIGFAITGLVLGMLQLFYFNNFTSMLILLAALAGFSLFVACEAYASARQLAGYTPGPANRWWVYGVFVAVSLVLGLGQGFMSYRWAFRNYHTPTASMDPAIHAGDYFMVEFLGAEDPIERGDIVLFISPTEEKDFVKRVLGLPGETVEIRSHAVFVDGRKVDEPYAISIRLGAASKGDFGPLRLGQGMYFVLGDNRDNSYDSRQFGPVGRQRIKGRALYISFPANLGKAGWGARLGKRLR